MNETNTPSPYGQGTKAWYTGLTVDENPYASETEDHKDWHFGHQDAAHAQYFEERNSK